MITVPSSLHRSAWLEIDLDAIRHNIETVRSIVGSATIAAVVKANAYGHGIERVGPVAAKAADMLCVATLDEALALRSMVTSRVLQLYPVPEAGAAEAVAAGVELTLMSPADMRVMQSASRAAAGPVAVHLCVETGMGRGGVAPADATAIATEVASDPRLRLAGLWSHLATPEEPTSAREQVRRFDLVAASLRAAGLTVPDRHIAASGGIFMADAPTYELVRPGLAVYGMLGEGLPVSAGAVTAAASLRPAMSLKARAATFSDIDVGDGVGYGGSWRAERPSRVAVLPLGYADGYLRGAQPGGFVLVDGVRRPIAGAVSMDAVAVDVTDAPDVDGATEFVLLGEQGRESITASELARQRNTIAWEVLSGMAQRIDRVYYPEAGQTFPK